jgi:hypothetical protein
MEMENKWTSNVYNMFFKSSQKSPTTKNLLGIPNIQIFNLYHAPFPIISSMFNLSRNPTKANPNNPFQPLITFVLKPY